MNTQNLRSKLIVCLAVYFADNVKMHLTPFTSEFASRRAAGRQRGLHPNAPFADSKRFTPRPRNAPSSSGNPFTHKLSDLFSWKRAMLDPL